jgi:hyperosmotically inducible periplasmic protein
MRALLNHPEVVMKNRNAIVACLVSVALAGPAYLVAAEPSDADSSHPTQYVKDSAITTAVKSKLAADHLSSLTRIKVDTDQNGIVWLSGSTDTQEAADRAVDIARNTDGVAQVKSNIVVAPETK